MPSLRVSVLQAPAPDFGRAGEVWAELLDRIDDAAQDEPDLIVLPEASYPAWFLGRAAESPPDIDDARLIEALAERAAHHGVHIAAGLVLGRPSDPQNAAVLVSPQRAEIARASESRPAPWFRAGRGPAAAEMNGIAVALFAGADHLDPRWIEAIAEARTQLIVATGAARGWPHGGSVADDPVDAIVPARAAESGAWIAAAGRAGVEADAVGYAGGAGIASPLDGWVARAPSDRPGIVLHACEIAPAAPGLGATPPSILAEPTPIDGGTTRFAALAFDPSPSAVDLMESVRAAVRAAAALGAGVIVLPDLTGRDPRAITRSETQPLIEAVSAETRTVVIAACAERAMGQVYRSMTIVEDGRTLATHRQSILTDADRAAGFQPGTDAPPVVRTISAGTLGLLAGREAMSPAAVAALRRGGAQAIAWCAGAGDRLVGPLARTRAWEQRLPVIAAGTVLAGAWIAAEGGSVLAASRPATPMLVHASVERRAIRAG